MSQRAVSDCLCNPRYYAAWDAVQINGWERDQEARRNASTAPSRTDYEALRASFSWDAVRQELDGLPGGAGLNIAQVAVDRHAHGSRRGQVALRWIDKRDRVHDHSYARLGELTNRLDGYFWFVGRADDLISGHLIGPFEIESALMEHPAVAEAGVIGMPDPLVVEVVKAFVALKPGYAPDESLKRELLALARRRLGPAVAPKAIEFRQSLPETLSGKIMRRLLKAQELELPEGDVSSLEESDSVTTARA